MCQWEAWAAVCVSVKPQPVHSDSGRWLSYRRIVSEPIGTWAFVFISVAHIGLADRR